MLALPQRAQPALLEPVPRTATEPAPARVRPVTVRHRHAHYIVNQALFREALVRERRRSDRFEQSFGLVLISLTRGTHERHWTEVLDALTATRRDTDVIGWFREGAVLGLIRSHVDLAPHKTPASLGATVRGEIERCITPGASTPFRIRCGFHSPNAGIPHEGVTAGALFEAGSRPGGRGSDLVYRASKRALDIVASAALLALCSPIFLIIGALVKWTSQGPVVYRQERVGQRGRPFRMLKFRTMLVNTGHEIHQQFVTQFIQGGAASEAAPAAAPAVFKIVGDPRVTPLGSFLRRSSLDEVPQFWNVLKGEMSLVGPRPPLPYEVKCYKLWHLRRVLEAKPGITGLWQVTGRSRTTFDEMVRLDIRYARTRSIRVDLKILLATPRAVISGTGAH